MAELRVYPINPCQHVVECTLNSCFVCGPEQETGTNCKFGCPPADAISVESEWAPTA